MGCAAVLRLLGVPIPVLLLMWILGQRCIEAAGCARTAKESTVHLLVLKVPVALATVGLLIAGCGERPVDRALTGGAIGAGSGAVVGSTVGSPVAGAVVGGAAGATIGAATAPER